MSAPNTQLHRLKRVKNQNYVRDGTKSYGHLLRKYNIKPSMTGPFDMIDEVSRPRDQNVVRRLQDRMAGRPSKVNHRTLVKKSPTGQVGEISATDIQNDSEYLVQVGIGTPKQMLNLDFDTGSADLSCWSTELPSKVQAEGKRNHHVIFNHALSHTYKPIAGAKWMITYGDGSSAGGDVGADIVNIGGIVVDNQAVELAQTLSSEFQSGAGDGLLGLAFSSINTVTPTPAKTPVENMILQSSISSASELFTAHLGSVKDTNDADHGSSFYTFGFIDQNALTANNATVNDIHYTPVDNSNGFWQIASASYSVNNSSFPLTGNSAIMDTGTTLALVDSTTCKNIYAAIPGSKIDHSQGGYVFPSNTALSALPTISFDIGGQMFSINTESLAYASVGNGYTYGAIQDRGDLPFSIYGDAVLKNLYAIFDVGRMRFGAVQMIASSTGMSSSATAESCNTNACGSCQSCATGDRDDMY